jgi:hypothetical protein
VFPTKYCSCKASTRAKSTGCESRRNPVQVSSTAFNHYTRLDLGWHPYRMPVRHELLPNDYLRRLRFSQWYRFNQKCEEDPHFLDHVVIGDEASFVMDGEVNSHNVRGTHLKDILQSSISTEVFSSEAYCLGRTLREWCHFRSVLFWEKCERRCIPPDVARICLATPCCAFQGPLWEWVVSRPLPGDLTVRKRTGTSNRIEIQFRTFNHLSLPDSFVKLFETLCLCFALGNELSGTNLK